MSSAQSAWYSLSSALLDLFLMLGIQALFLILLACALEYACRTAQEKRRLWQLVIVLMGTLVALETLGIGVWLQPKSAPARQDAAIAQSPSASHAVPRSTVSTALNTQTSNEWLPAGNPSTSLKDRVGLMAGTVWLIGSSLMLISLITVQVLLRHIGYRLLPLLTPGLTRHIRDLSKQLGIRKQVRVGHRAAVQTPYVFGIWQPTLVLPSSFPPSLTSQHQNAVLVHELAHLAGRDPLWQLLCDLVVAILWWHPACWLLRQRWRYAAETVADEATTLLNDGPFYLAESLLAWQQLPTWWRPGLAMLPRSSSWLTQRIRHLLSIVPATSDYNRSWLVFRWVRTSLLVLVIMVVMIGTSSARLNTVREDEPMWSFRVLRHSVLGLAFLAATETGVSAQGQASQDGQATSNDVIAMGKSEDGAALALGLDQREMAQFKAFIEQRNKKMVALRELGDSPERLEAAKAFGTWYQESFKKQFSSEKYDRYFEYWRFNHLTIKSDQEQGSSLPKVSVDPHPFDADMQLFKDMKLSEEQIVKITSLRNELKKGSLSMNDQAKTIKGVEELPTLIAKQQKLRNDQLKAILTSEQYQQYRAVLDTIIHPGRANLPRPGNAEGKGVTAPGK